MNGTVVAAAAVSPLPPLDVHELAHDRRAVGTPWTSVKLCMPWPAPAFSLACPGPIAFCELLTAMPTCSEPEQETAEVLNSLLLRCDPDRCLYIDIGCNIGYFAALASAHGATSECYEPTPLWLMAARRTVALNPRFVMNVREGAVVSEAVASWTEKTIKFADTHKPCGVGVNHPLAQTTWANPWTVPKISIRRLLRGRHVTLLKLDVDSIEGQLLHEATDMLVAQQTSIDSILVELGWGNFSFTGQRTWEPHPRLGDVHDLWRLQELGYDVWRINIHVNREIFDHTGHDVNQPRSEFAHEKRSYEDFLHVRSMRKLERLRRHRSSRSYPGLIGWGQSFLISTRVQLLQPMKHHAGDLEASAGAKAADYNLNRGWLPRGMFPAAT